VGPVNLLLRNALGKRGGRGKKGRAIRFLQSSALSRTPQGRGRKGIKGFAYNSPLAPLLLPEEREGKGGHTLLSFCIALEKEGGGGGAREGPFAVVFNRRAAVIPDREGGGKKKKKKEGKEKVDVSDRRMASVAFETREKEEGKEAAREALVYHLCPLLVRRGRGRRKRVKFTLSSVFHSP